MSGSCAARCSRLSSRRADSIAPIAWLANTRSACSASSEGSSRSFGSSTHIIPSSRPAESCSGTTTQWWFQASGPRPLETDEYTPPKSGARSTATSRSMTMQPWRMYAGSSSCSSAATGTSGNSAARSGVKPTPDSGTSLPSSARKATTLWKPSASRVPQQTASSTSSAVRRSVSFADTASRCSTAARWRRPSSAVCACSTATAACATTVLSSSSSIGDGRRPVSGSSTDTIPSSAPSPERIGTISASSGCQASGASETSSSGV